MLKCFFHSQFMNSYYTHSMAVYLPVIDIMISEGIGIISDGVLPCWTVWKHSKLFIYEATLIVTFLFWWTAFVANLTCELLKLMLNILL